MAFRKLPPPRESARLLVEIAPRNVAMFRFLLETYENLAYFSVLDRKLALLKISFSPQSRKVVVDALEDIKFSAPLVYYDWPDFKRS